MISKVRGPGALLAAVAAASVAAGTMVASPATAAPGDSRTRFIITVADGVDSRAVAEEHRRSGAKVDFVYTAALNGFAGAMSQADLGALQRDRRVTRIERDGIATASETQSDATWGLDRIDARSGLDGTYSYTPTGSGVHAYIIDTGIRLTHTDFVGRAASGFDAIDGGPADDCNGHGTHVAGTVGGTFYGVAKAAQLVGVRVLDCAGSGTWSGVIAGMDWVTTHHVKPAVANMSLGGGASTSVDDAVRAMIEAGVTTVVAAGNGNQGGKAQDACGYSPARVPAAVTIGATTSSDVKTSWSNYGSCVDFFAPGAGITSAWYTGDSATNTISGTSMAAPHVAGVAALYLQGDADASPQQVRDAMYAATTKDIVTSSNTANDHLIFSDVPAGTPQNAPPTAHFSPTCTGLSCTFDGSGSTDSDGSISSYAWQFHDGTAASGVTATYAYAAAGNYLVTLTVTDNAGASGTTSQTVSVTAPSTNGITLSARGYKVKGLQQVDLSWTGAAGSVDVFRDGSKIATVSNSSYTDKLGKKGGGSYAYMVCAGTTPCSNEVIVTF